MDDFCQRAKVFTNKEAQQRHTYEHSRDLNTVYKKSLSTAFKHCKELEEVPGMNSFLGKEVAGKKKKQVDPQLRALQALEKYDCDESKWRSEVERLLNVLNSTDFNMIDKKRSRRGKRSDPFSRLSTTMGKIKRTQIDKEAALQQTLAKVELDKYILMKEKLEAIWNDKLYRLTGPYDIKQDMHR